MPHSGTDTRVYGQGLGVHKAYSDLLERVTPEVVKCVNPDIGGIARQATELMRQELQSYIASRGADGGTPPIGTERCQSMRHPLAQVLNDSELHGLTRIVMDTASERGLATFRLR